MNEQELLNKIENDRPLTSQEEAWLDAQLACEEQLMAAARVSELSDVEPSLAWRSDLSLRLLRESKPGFWRRVSRSWVWAPTAAVAAAAVMFAAVGTQNAPEKLPADTMLQWHEEAVASTLLPGDGTGMAGFVASGRSRKPDPNDDLLYGGKLESL